MSSRTKVFILKFFKKEKISSTIYSFYFSSQGQILHTPGQYLQMVIPHKKVDERGSSRFFTIASSPTEKGYVMITTRVEKSSFKQALFNLKKGTTIQCFGPMGIFALDIF